MISTLKFDPSNPIPPDSFANLTADEQTAYQRSQADYFTTLALGGASISPAQSDFVSRITGKNFGSVPNQTLYDNLVSGATETISGAGSALGKFELKTLVIPLMMAVVILLIIAKVKE